MAILNPETGRVVQGGDKTACYVDGSILVHPYGAHARWLDANTVIYVTGNPADLLDPTDTRVETFNLVTGAREVLANHGANVLEAGGGRWCGWFGDGQVGLFGDIADPYAGIRHVGADGTIATIPVYADGLGVRLYSPDGRVTEGPREAMKGFRVLGPTSGMWTTDGEIRALNARVPVEQVGKAFRPKRVAIKSEEWIVYETEIGIVAHPYDSLLGYRLNAAGSIFWMDAIAWQNQIRIAYCTDERDSPNGLILTDIDVTAPRYQLPNLGRGGAFNLAAVEKRVFITGGATAAGPTTSTKSVIKAQNGMLEDDIAYRLTLLATNVLEPLKAAYPQMVIRSGFRESNSGVGQHETGEAVDIQLKNQTPELLYECASWIRDHLPFDQLILNYTLMGDQKPWIHVSFSPTSLRYDVLTKDFADTFHEGLGYVDEYTPAERDEANRIRAEIDAMVLADLQAKQARDNRDAGKQTIVTDEVTDLISENVVDRPRPEYVDVITRIKDIMMPYIGGLSDEEKAFNILIRVVWQLRGEGLGLIITPVNSRGFQIAEDNEDFFVNYRGPRGTAGSFPGSYIAGGYNISGQWVGYSSGLMYQILGPRGVFVPQWTAQTNKSTTNLPSSSRWRPPIDPGDDFTGEWRAVTLKTTDK
jgi:hypothetical protein